MEKIIALRPIKDIEHEWNTSPRWKGIVRDYTAADVARLHRGVKGEQRCCEKRGDERINCMTQQTNNIRQRIPLERIFRALFLAPIIGFLPLLIFMLFYDFHAALPVYASFLSFSYLFVIFLAIPATLILRLFIFQISVTACTLWGFALGGILPLFSSITASTKESFFAGIASLTLPLLIGIIGAFIGFVFGKLIQPKEATLSSAP